MIVNESLRTPVTVPPGYFPEVELLGEEGALRHISLRGQRGGKWTQSPFAVVSVSIARLAFIWVIRPKTLSVYSKDNKALCEQNGFPLSRQFIHSTFYICSADLLRASHLVALCTLQLFIHELFQIFLEV